MTFLRFSKPWLLFIILVCPSLIAQVQEIECEITKITDERDFTKNIPGETMGQKLESLLFWSQEEKERRFPIMQSIYPSIAVAAGSEVYAYQENENLTPKWDNNTNLQSYIEENRIGGLIVIKDNVKR